VAIKVAECIYKGSGAKTKNSYKGGSPWKIITGCLGKVKRSLLSLPPIILDHLPTWKTEYLVYKADKYD